MLIPKFNLAPLSVCYDSYHSRVEGDTSADVPHFSASFWCEDARPAPPPALILAPAVAGKEDHSHTETVPPVHTHITVNLTLPLCDCMPGRDVSE